MPNVNRITVPECYSCKAIWEVAEPHFKNTLLAIWNPDELPNDSRVQSMWRGFNEKDGRRRARDLASQFRTVEIGGVPRTKVYPDEDPSFNLILRRIVRGLIHKHRLGTAIADERVSCKVMRWMVPPAFESEFTWYVIADDFVRYAYARSDEESIHSFWLVRFSSHIAFFGFVATENSEA